MKNGCYEEYYKKTLLARYNIYNNQYYGLCVNYSNGRIYRACEYFNDDQCLVSMYDSANKKYMCSNINSKNPKVHLVNYKDDRIEHEIYDRNDSMAVNVLNLTKERGIKTKHVYYIGELGLNIFHYMNGKIRMREKNGSIKKYYKNGYKRSLYKNKTYLFY